jgi:hypothetical protein
VLIYWNTTQVPTEKSQERTTQGGGKIEYQDTESNRNELKKVNQIGGLSAPSLAIEKTIETTLQIASAQVIFFQTRDESAFDVPSYRLLHKQGRA